MSCFHIRANICENIGTARSCLLSVLRLAMWHEVLKLCPWSRDSCVTGVLPGVLLTCRPDSEAALYVIGSVECNCFISFHVGRAGMSCWPCCQAFALCCLLAAGCGQGLNATIAGDSGGYLHTNHELVSFTIRRRCFSWHRGLASISMLLGPAPEACMLCRHRYRAQIASRARANKDSLVPVEPSCLKPCQRYLKRRCQRGKLQSW